MPKKIEFEIGDVVCDMHDVPARTGAIIAETWIISKIIQVRMRNSSDVLDMITAPKRITNKEAVVVGETYDGKGYQCAYSYDGDRFGLFEIEPY